MMRSGQRTRQHQSKGAVHNSWTFLSFTLYPRSPYVATLPLYGSNYSFITASGSSRPCACLALVPVHQLAECRLAPLTAGLRNNSGWENGNAKGHWMMDRMTMSGTVSQGTSMCCRMALMAFSSCQPVRRGTHGVGTLLQIHPFPTISISHPDRNKSSPRRKRSAVGSCFRTSRYLSGYLDQAFPAG